MGAGQCKGICDTLLTYPLSGRFTHGFPKCSKCDVRFDTSDIFCPCCKTRLRRSPRGGTARKRMVARAPRVS